MTGHGGALRGWRSHRMYLPAECISVVVLFNHMADAQAAAADLLAAVLGEERPQLPAAPPPDWLGAYLEPETGLVVRLDQASDGQARLRYGHSAEMLAPQADGTAGNDGTRLRPGEDGLWMGRPQDNQSACAPAAASRPSTSPAAIAAASWTRC